MNARRALSGQRARQRGMVLVELALVLPLLVLLLAAAVEFALALASYQVALKQVRLAARYLSTLAPGAGHAPAECLLRTGRLEAALPCSAPPLLAGLAAPGVQVSVQDALNAPATHRAQRSSPDATDSAAVRMNLVTVRLSGLQHRLVLGGVLQPLLGRSALAFGPMHTTLRQGS